MNIHRGTLLSSENASIRDPTTIQFLFEVSRALHDEINLLSKRDDENREAASLISRFLNMVKSCFPEVHFPIIINP